MLRQATNKVLIEGILSEVKINYGSYVKDGKTVENIGGTINVRVNQRINGEDVVCEIPVRLYSQKYTRAGAPNPAYESIQKVMDTYTSIAAAGSEEGADKVRLTASIRMNEFYGQDGALHSYKQIQASFVNRATGEFKPRADFELEFALSDMKYATDKDGVEQDGSDGNAPRFEIKAAVPQYGGVLDYVPLVATNPKVIDHIKTYWEKGKTYRANGTLLFKSETHIVTKEVDFGEPIEETRTFSTHDILVRGGAQDPLQGDFAFAPEELKKAASERENRLNDLKTKNISKKTPAPVRKDEQSAGEDLGF